MKLKHMEKPSFVRYHEYSAMLQVLKEKKGTVLDIGCNETNLTEYLKELGFNSIGIDLHPDRRNIKADIRKMDARKTEFKQETFDFIVVISTIEHIGFEGDPRSATLVDPDGDFKVMKEIKRILKKDGIVIISFPYLSKSHQANERSYTQERVTLLIDGFEIIEERIFSGPNTSSFRETNHVYPEEINVMFLVLKKKEEQV